MQETVLPGYSTYPTVPLAYVWIGVSAALAEPAVVTVRAAASANMTAALRTTRV
jgi:hypothetical protein